MEKSKVVSRKSKLQLAFFITLISAVVFSIAGMPRLSIPLGVSYVTYLIIGPAVPGLIKLGLNRTAAVISVFVALIFFTTYPVVKVVPTVVKEAENFQYYLPKVENYLRVKYLEGKVKLKEKTGFELSDKYINQSIDVAKRTTTNVLLSIPKILASFLEWVFIVPLFIFFLLRDGKKFKQLVLKLTPNSIFERTYYLFHQFNKQLGDYIFAKFVEASIVGLIITSGLLIIDVRFSLILGLLAGVTNIIPYVGPLLGAVPGILFGLAEYGPSPTFGAMCLLYLIANAVDIGLVFPILVSKIVNIHPLMVVISVILGSQYLGILGMIISIPCAAALKLIFIEIYNGVYKPNT